VLRDVTQQVGRCEEGHVPDDGTGALHREVAAEIQISRHHSPSSEVTATRDREPAATRARSTAHAYHRAGNDIGCPS
jgi:hypothetical protein